MRAYCLVAIAIVFVANSLVAKVDAQLPAHDLVIVKVANS